MTHRYALEVSTAPGAEPITLVQARLHLRLTATGSPASHPDDDLVTGLITTARELVEGHMARAIITQTLKMYMDHWPWDGVILLPRSPVIIPSPTTLSILYIDTSGDNQTWDSSNYRVDNKSEPARITLEDNKSFPDLQPVTNNVIVTFDAGYGGSPSPVPKHITSAMLLMLAHLYEHREVVQDVPSGASLLEMPFAYQMLVGHDPVWAF